MEKLKLQRCFAGSYFVWKEGKGRKEKSKQKKKGSDEGRKEEIVETFEWRENGEEEGKRLERRCDKRTKIENIERRRNKVRKE